MSRSYRFDPAAPAAIERRRMFDHKRAEFEARQTAAAPFGRVYARQMLDADAGVRITR